MKIISKFKDYYDQYSYLGIDPLCRYDRFPVMYDHHTYIQKFGSIFSREFNNKLSWTEIPKIFTPRYDIYSKDTISLTPCWILFCGRFYLLYIKETADEYSKYSFVTATKKEIISDLNQVGYIYKNYKKKTTRTYWYSERSVNRLIENMKNLNGIKIPDEIFIKANTPIISNFGFEVLSGRHTDNLITSHIFINPQLAKLKFIDRVDPMTAWQELSMYLMDVLKVSERSMIQLDDKYRIHAHGYDKHSFRRDSHPNKPRKNKN